MISLEAAKVIGAGLAAIGVGAAAAGVGTVFGSFLQGALRNPAAADGQQAWELFASTLKEAGFEAELVFQEYGSYIQSTYLGKMPEGGCACGPLIGSPRDPDNMFNNYWSESARHNWGGTPIAEHLAFHIENTARDGGVSVAKPLTRLEREIYQMHAELREFLVGRIAVEPKET